MVNLILYSLTLASMTLTYPVGNNTTTTLCGPDAIEYQDGNAFAYHYSSYDDGERLRDWNGYQMSVTGSRQFDFIVELEKGNNGEMDYYSFRFATWHDSYMSNLYLANLKYHYVSDNNSEDGNLPNVYFLGQVEYYEDDTSGNYTLFFEHDTGQEMYLDFDFYLMPSTVVDGSAYQNGYNNGWNAGNDAGFEDGYANGYNDGYTDAEFTIDAQGTTARIIFEGIINIALLPINFFLACLNFEVFGINIGAFVTSLLTVAIAIIIFRIIFSGGNGSSSGSSK